VRQQTAERRLQRLEAGIREASRFLLLSPEDQETCLNLPWSALQYDTGSHFFAGLSGLCDIPSSAAALSSWHTTVVDSSAQSTAIPG
jgi:hypothetical protein